MSGAGNLEEKRAMLAKAKKSLTNFEGYGPFNACRLLNPYRQAPLEERQTIWACILDDRAKFDDVLH
jgi:kinetochore protein NDC80